MSVEVSNRQWGPGARSGLAVGLALVILLGPAYRQMLGGTHPFMPKWTMFSGMATNFYAVSMTYRSRAESWRPVPADWIDEPASSFGHAAPPRQASRLRRLSDVERALQRVCRHLGPSSLIAVDVRQARRSGWKDVVQDKELRCSAVVRGRMDLE